MIQFRPFRNSDPPALCEIWRNQAPARGLMQPITHSVLEELVFCKPHFDPHGLIVALDDGGPVGFVHAGFAPTDDRMGLDYSHGITCLLMVNPEGGRELEADLLAASEAYLAGHAAEEFNGGWIGRESPFYQGLYGGSLSPGILRSNPHQVELYESGGYSQACSCSIWQCELASFRPAIDREIMQLRRRFALCRASDPPPSNWWDAVTIGQLDQIRFELVPSGQQQPIATASFWDVEPLASSWGVHAMGLLDLQINSTESRELLATFLLGGALRELKSYGAAVVEVQTDADDHGMAAACQRLGFQQIDQGIQFRKLRRPEESADGD